MGRAKPVTSKAGLTKKKRSINPELSFEKTLNDVCKFYKEIINSSEKIAVTAGASTPDYIIENVINTIKGGK